MTPDVAFWERVDQSGGPIACWPWRGTRTPTGYGHWRGRPAHRVAYEVTKGPVPSELVMDHLCRNPPCVNPNHLEPVTTRENTLRGIGVTATNARKAACKRGHRFTRENITWRADRRGNLWRCCRACQKLDSQMLAARRLAARAARRARPVEPKYFCPDCGHGHRSWTKIGLRHRGTAA